MVRVPYKALAHMPVVFRKVVFIGRVLMFFIVSSMQGITLAAVVYFHRVGAVNNTHLFPDIAGGHTVEVPVFAHHHVVITLYLAPCVMFGNKRCPGRGLKYRFFLIHKKLPAAECPALEVPVVMFPQLLPDGVVQLSQRGEYVVTEGRIDTLVGDFHGILHRWLILRLCRTRGQQGDVVMVCPLLEHIGELWLVAADTR